MPNSSVDSPEVEKPKEDTANDDNIMGAGSLKLNLVSEFKFDVESIKSPVEQTICTDMIQKITERPDCVQIINNTLLRVRCENQLNPEGGSIVKMDEKTDYPQVIDIRPPILSTYIKFVDPIIVGHLDMTVATFYSTEGEINCHQIASILHDNCMISKTLSENLASAFTLSLHKFDLTTLFVLTALYESSLYFANIAGLNLAQRNMENSGITICDMSAEGQQAEANLAIATEAIKNNRICFDSKYLSSQDIQLLRALTVGANALVTATGENYTHIGCTFISPGLRFMLYRDEPWELPAVVTLTADTVRASALHLAVLLNDRGAYVKGYVRAQTMLNGMIATQRQHIASPRYQHYFMSSLENRMLDLPQPLGHNFLWRLMKLDVGEHNPYDNKYYMNEFLSLSSLPAEMSVRVGAAVATIFGLGISATLHTWNISGACLNEYIRTVPGEYHTVRKYLDILFQCKNIKTSATIFRTASAFVAQFTKSTLNSDCFQSSKWNSNANAIGNDDESIHWLEVWGRNIPYIVRPLCISWHLEQWPSLWGYSSPTITFDLQELTISDDDPEEHRLALGKAESRYNATLMGRNPFEYVPYGNMMLNTLSQHLREHYPLLVSYLAIKLANGKFYIDQQWQEGVGLQPTYMPKFFSFEVGQMPTYDWNCEVMIIPHIRRMLQKPHIWVQLLVEIENASMSKCAGISK